MTEKVTEKGGGTRLQRTMGLWTGISIIIGNIIGGGIFVSPVAVLRSVGSPAGAILVWAFCGLLCMTGAFCYAELGLTIPTSGGDYIYVMRTFGPLLAFLRLWIAILGKLYSELRINYFLLCNTVHFNSILQMCIAWKSSLPSPTSNYGMGIWSICSVPFLRRLSS